MDTKNNQILIQLLEFIANDFFVQVLELMREILEDNCDYMGEGSDTSDENNHADNTPFKQRSTYLQRSGLFVVFFLFCGETLLKVSFVGRFIRILKRPFKKSFHGTRSV